MAAALAEAGMAAEAAVAAVASASATPAASEPSRAHAADLVLLGHLIASRLVGGDSDFAKVWKEAVVPVAAASRTDWQVGMCAEITRPLVGRVSAHTLPAGTVGRIAGRADDGERWQLLVDGPKGQGTVEIKPELLRATSRPAAILSLWRSFPIAPSPYTAVREARRAVGESGGTIPLPVTVLSGFLGAGRRGSTISALYLPWHLPYFSPIPPAGKTMLFKISALYLPMHLPCISPASRLHLPQARRRCSTTCSTTARACASRWWER